MSDAPLESGKSGGVFETRDDAGKGQIGLVRLWLSAIRLASEDEKDWRKAADDVGRIYRGANDPDKPSFNILFSNTETIRSAVYNSVPVPDIRRRFSDDDEAGKVAGQVVERAVSYSVDTHDFDGEMKAAVKDAVLQGRGVTRVRYEPTVDADAGTAHEAVGIEHVQWRDFRHGPSQRWDGVPWVAFRHLLTREQVTALSPKIGATVPLDMRSDGSEVKSGQQDEAPSDVFKRLLVWEIWDKEQREVLFIAPSYSNGPLAREDDPLKLVEFFPIPRPLYAIENTDSMVPVEPYRLYRALAEELDTITKRINAIVKVIKWRGIRAITENDAAFTRLDEAKDGELVPAESAIMFAQAGGLDKAIWLMPIEQAVNVVRELYLAREQIKQTIFEITGIADILRGSTNAGETATAQRIKAQWGSLRISDLQNEAARYARDLIRLMTEIICTRFDWPTLSTMTQTKLPTQAEKQAAMAMMQMQQQQMQQQGQGQQPQQPPPMPEFMDKPTVEEVEQIIRSDVLRCYRIDVETDSTIRADVTRQQENVAQFVQGFAAFVAAVGPAVEARVMPLDVATDLLTGFARVFKLGRQAEDALERLGKQGQQPQQPQADPQAGADAAKMMLEQSKLEATSAEAQDRLSLDSQKMQQEGAIKKQELALREREIAMQERAQEQDFALRGEELQVKSALDAAKIEDGQKARQEQSVATEQQRRDAGLPPNTYEEDVKEVVEALRVLAEAMAAVAQEQNRQTAAILEVLSAPKQVVRGKSGRVEGVRTVLN